jgi:hypothetical protein
VILAAGGADRPPECVTVEVMQPAGPAWLEFCGSGPGRESALHDQAGPQIVDGFAALIRPSDCPRAAPCVIVAASSPPS